MAGPEAGQTLKAMLIDMHSQWTPWGTYPSIGSLSLLMIYSNICREAIWLVRWSTTSCTTLICLGFPFRFGLFWYYHEYPSSCRTSIIQTWCFAVSQDSTEQSMLLVTSISPPGVSLYSGKWKWSCGLVFGCLSVCLSVDGQNILWLTRGWKSCNCFTTFIFTLVWHSFLVTSFGMWPARPAWWNQDCLWGEERANNHRRRWFQMISTDFSFTKGTLGKWSNLTVRKFFLNLGVYIKKPTTGHGLSSVVFDLIISTRIT